MGHTLRTLPSRPGANMSSDMLRLVRNTSSIARVRSVGALGSAMVCQQSFQSAAVYQNITAITGKDRAVPHNFIQRAREEILRQLKRAFCELIVVEQFYNQGDSYYATLGVKRAASDTDLDDNLDKLTRKGKQVQYHKW